MLALVSRWVGPVAALGALGLLVGCSHLMKPRDGADPDGCPPGDDCHVHLKLEKNPTLLGLGHDLDHLEKHIDWYGSATAKGPDVWGQARLTQYREQFEALMNPTESTNQLEFTAGLQGSLARSDQAFFAQATALSNAAQPKPPVVGSVTSTKVEAAPLVPTAQTIQVVSTDPNTNAETTTNTTLGTPLAPTPAAPPAAAPPAFTPIQPVNPATLLTGASGAIQRGLVATPIGFVGGNVNGAGIGLEPTLMVAQKKRYLDFLNQIRRENEGDDTADSPGYALHLVRVPVSILPGKRTDEGYGAEVTMSLNPVLSPELLPTTFRNLVTNDLVNTLGFPVTKFLDEDRGRAADERYMRDSIRELIRNAELEELARFRAGGPTRQPSTAGPLYTQAGAEEKKKADPQADQSGTGKGNLYTRLQAETGQNKIDKLRADFKSNLAVPALSFTNSGQDREPFPTSQLVEIYGVVFGFEVAFGAHQALRREMEVSGYAHLPAVQSYLREEIRAAYQFLAVPTNHHLWDAFCSPEMVALIRSQQWERLGDKRREFRDQVQALTGSQPLGVVQAAGQNSVTTNPVRDTRQMQITAALAWGVLVDSALLTDRLMRDMKEASAAKGKVLAACQQWLPYYLPDPPPEARAAFNEYVALRWPVRVFALDPYTQDQNIADALSTRRETQLALSIAFTNGFIGANTLTQYNRRLEAEYETIALNRTQVGFSHGENVFGWRFYPRFQTPDTESNLTVLVRDQLLGGPNRNALLRQRRLEPGPRECVAVVMMPTFVPQATLDVNTNWFGLANPKHKVLDHTQALKLSRTVQAIKMHGPRAGSDANCYRDGEFPRLLRRAEQLEARLPTQTLAVPLPAANTLGGFEMFSNGTTDLAPELYGWYGAPGVSQAGTTTLFLVGDHFSPLHTNVVIGNQPAKRTLLSREVMKVEVSGPLLTVTDPATKRVYAQAHVATPYGVTRELLIPVDGTKPTAAAPAEGYSLKADAISLPYCKTGKGEEGKYRLAARDVSGKVVVAWDDALGVAPAKIKVTLGFSYNSCPFTVDVPGEFSNDKGSYTIPPDALKGAANKLFGTFNQFGPFTDATNPLAQVLPATVVITPVDGDRAVKAVTLTTPLKLSFECSICPTGTPPAPELPVEPKKMDEPKKNEDKGVGVGTGLSLPMLGCPRLCGRLRSAGPRGRPGSRSRPRQGRLRIRYANGTHGRWRT